jgi:acyl-CoA reductase-like NAD-dependent aldehyde dehydrogenase
MSETITTISPITNKGIIERKGLSDSELSDLASRSAEAFKTYKKTTLDERKSYVKKALDIILSKQDELAKEITEQMGRPIAYTGVEVKTAVARGEYLLKIAEDALSDTPGEPQEGFNRFIRKVPLGPVLVLFPWNVSLVASVSHSYHYSC